MTETPQPSNTPEKPLAVNSVDVTRALINDYKEAMANWSKSRKEIKLTSATVAHHAEGLTMSQASLSRAKTEETSWLYKLNILNSVLEKAGLSRRDILKLDREAFADDSPKKEIPNNG